MKAVILAGGEGTRLRPLTYSIPKPLLPVGRKPILEIIIERLRNHGFTDIVLNVGYKAELIQSYFRDGSSLDVHISYVRDDVPCGTCGPVKAAEHLLDGQPFITMNGDLLTDLDFEDMYRAHMDNSAELTMAIKEFSVKLQYGVVYIQNDRLASIREKPEFEILINAGIYVLSLSALDIVPQGEFYNMTDLIQKLVDRGRKVDLYPIDCEWWDLGTMETYQRTNMAYLEEIQRHSQQHIAGRSIREPVYERLDSDISLTQDILVLPLSSGD